MPGDIYFGIIEDGKRLELGNNDKVILKPGSILELTKLLPCELGNRVHLIKWQNEGKSDSIFASFGEEKRIFDPMA